MNSLDGHVFLGILVAAKATLLLLAAFSLSFLARKTSASARHVLWALTFVFLLLTPGMAYVAYVEREMGIPIAVLSPEPVPLSPAPGTPAPSPNALRPGTERATAAPMAATSSTSIPWSLLAGSLWAGGTLLFLCRLLLGFVSSRRVLAESEPISEPGWTDSLDQAREVLGVRESVALLRSDGVSLPMTLGILRHAILLPAAAADYSTSRRSAVILHELAHVRRRDCGSQLISALAAAAFWWNPLVWIAFRHMRLLSERAADDLVLAAGARPSDYAHDLLEMARVLHKGQAAMPLGSVAMAHRSRFEERLLAILDPRVARGAVTSRFVLAAGLGALPLVISLLLAGPTAATAPTRPVAAQAEEPKTPRTPEPATPAREPREAQEAQQAEEPRERDEREEPRTAEDRAAREAAKVALAGALDDPEASVRERALHALVQIGDTSIAPYLEKALADASPGTRAQAAWGLGQMGRAESVTSLVAALKDADEDVREQAAWALGMIRDPRATAGLNDAVGDEEESVREQAVWALGMIESRESVDGLVTALSDASPEVRSQAAWALGTIRDSRAVEALSRALKDEDPDVREQAAWALGVIATGEDEEETPRPDRGSSTPRPDPIVRADPEAVRARFIRGADF
jgi:beta-lactamase regulating signal transducer with metallopeptidase domain